LSKTYLPFEGLAKLWELLLDYQNVEISVNICLFCSERVIIIIGHWELLCLCVFIHTGGIFRCQLSLFKWGTLETYKDRRKM